MALSRAAVPEAVSYQGTTTISTAWPSTYTPTAGDQAVLVVFSRHRTESTEPDPISGWTKTTALGGVTGAAADAGKVRVTVYTRVLTGGDAAPTVTLATDPAGGGALSAPQPYVYAKAAAGTFDVAVYPFDYTTSTLSWSAQYAGQSDLIAGDELVFAHGANTDAVTGIGTRTLTASGTSLGSTTEQVDAVTTNGDDMRWAVANNNVASGPATGLMTLGVTLTGTAATGVGALIRTREVTDRAYTFDGHTDGEAVTTGGDIVSLNGTPIYTTDAKHGGSALRGSGTAATVRIFHGQTRRNSGSIYAKAQNLDTSAARIIQFDTPTGGIVGSIRMHSDGKVDLANGTNTRVVATASSWVANTWHRIDWQLDSPSLAGAATCTIRFFLNAEGTTPDDTISTTLAAGDALRIQTGALGSDTDQIITVDTLRVRNGLQWIGPYAVAPTTVVVGEPAENDTAQPASRVKARSLGQPTEADSAAAVTRRKVRTLGQAAEADSALAATTVDGPDLIPTSLALETDTPLPVTRRKVRTLGLAAETDSGQLTTRARRRGAGQATESDSAQAATGVLGAGSVTHAWVGAPTTDGFRVRARTAGATSLRLAVSTSPAMTSPTYLTAQTPNSAGYVDFTVTGLPSGTQHYYQLADTPAGDVEKLIGAVGKVRTLPAQTAGGFTFAFGSCVTNNAVTSALTDLRSWDPDFWLHLGDFHYRNPTSTDPAVHRGLIEAQIAAAGGLAAALRDVPSFYVRSDHDAGPGDNADQGTEAPASIQAYQDVVPHPPLADSRSPKHGLYFAFTVRRVRFIMLDVRNTDRSPGATDPTSSGKTMLGATQKAWLLSELAGPEPVKVICSDVPWLGATQTTPTVANGMDKWWSYDAERTEIGNYISSNGIRVLLLHGDSHSMAYAAGTSNPKGGFPVWCSSPLHNVGGGLQLGTFDAVYNTGNTVVGEQYARVTVTDTGSTITLAYSAWDALNNTERLSTQAVFPVARAAATGQATEADTGQPVTRRKVRTLGLATETELAQPGSRRKTRTVGQATETDSGHAAGHRKVRTAGQPAETDLAQQAARRKVRTAGQPAETDAATAVTRTRIRGAGQPAEGDSAAAVTQRKIRTLGLAEESSTALHASRAVAGTQSLFAPGFPAAGPGGSQDLNGTSDNAKYVMGTHVRVTADGTVTGVRYFVPVLNQPTNPDFGVGLFRVDPTNGVLGSVSVLAWQAETTPGAGAAGTWVTFPLAAPQAVTAGDELYVAVRTNRYAYATHAFATDFVSGDLLGGVNSGPYPNGAFVTGSGADATPPSVPNGSFNETFYGVDLAFAAIGTSPITVQTGQATEVDASLPAARRKVRTLGLASDTSSATAAARRKTRTPGQASEADAGVTTGRRKARAVGLPSETSSAAAATRRRGRILGQATEVDAAAPLIITGKTIIPAGAAVETDAAAPAGRVKRRGLGIAGETSTAPPAGRQRLVLLGAPTETDVALPALRGSGSTQGVTVWTGSAETPAAVTRWDGTAEQPVGISVA